MGRIQTLNKQINMKQFLNFCTSCPDFRRKGRTYMYVQTLKKYVHNLSLMQIIKFRLNLSLIIFRQ